MANEYIEDSKDLVTLTLTSIDLKLFKENYHIEEIVYHGGYKFKSIKGLFTNYIDKWTERKITAKKEKNWGMYVLSKLMLNALYGKFSVNPNIRSKFPYVNDEGIVKYSLHEKEIKDPLYIPIGSFITSYARNKTIRTSQKIKDYSLEKYGKDMYIYSDTDSIHTTLPIQDIEKIIQLDDYKLRVLVT